MTDPLPCYALRDRSGRLTWITYGRQYARDSQRDDEEIVPGVFLTDEEWAAVQRRMGER